MRPLRYLVFFTDNPRARHAQRFDDSALWKIAIRFSGNSVNQHSQKDIVGVPVAPPFARFEIQRHRGHVLVELLFGEVETKVKRPVLFVRSSLSYSPRPDVWVRRLRTVMLFHVSGASGKYFAPNHRDQLCPLQPTSSQQLLRIVSRQNQTRHSQLHNRVS